MNYVKLAGLSLIIVSAFYGHHMQGMFGMPLGVFALTEYQKKELERKERIAKENVLIQQKIIDDKIENFQSNEGCQNDQFNPLDGSFGMNRVLFDRGNLIKKGTIARNSNKDSLLSKQQIKELKEGNTVTMNKKKNT